jgi:hypothetical protein
MEETSTQSDYHSVRVYYPPGDIWKTVHQLAYENKCMANGCPKGPGVKDNQGFEFPDESSARVFLEKVQNLITAEIAKGELFNVDI